MCVVVRAEGAINPSIKKGTLSSRIAADLVVLLRASSPQTQPYCMLGWIADVEKVVDMLKADELPKKAVFCRCWRSSKVRPAMVAPRVGAPTQP